MRSIVVVVVCSHTALYRVSVDLGNSASRRLSSLDRLLTGSSGVIDRVAAPYLQQLSPQSLAVITMHESVSTPSVAATSLTGASSAAECSACYCTNPTAFRFSLSRSVRADARRCVARLTLCRSVCSACAVVVCRYRPCGAERVRGGPHLVTPTKEQGGGGGGGRQRRRRGADEQ